MIKALRLRNPRKVVYLSEGRMPELPRSPLLRARAAGIGEHAMTGHTTDRLASVGIHTTKPKFGSVQPAWIIFLAKEMVISSSQESAAMGRSPAGRTVPGTELIRGTLLYLHQTILLLVCRPEHAQVWKASTVNLEPKAKNMPFVLLMLAAVRTRPPEVGRPRGAHRPVLLAEARTSHRGLAALGPTADQAPAQRQIGANSTFGM